MALIDLSKIGELSIEALDGKHLVDSYCFNNGSKVLTPIDPAVHLRLYKAHRQADNLYKRLRQLHTICTDFVAGNIEPYRAKWEEYQEDESGTFDPFQELDWQFDEQSVYDLPEHISQYEELEIMADNFAHIRKRKREGFKKFFGELPMYVTAKNDEGETVMIPESELPESIRLNREVNEEIKQVEVEYCLDGYDAFYSQARALIWLHRESGNITECAKGILSLINSKSSPALSPPI